MSRVKPDRPKLVPTLVLLLASVDLAASADAHGGTAIAASPAQARRPAGAEGTVVVPDSFLRRWDPVTVFFATDLGPAAGGAEDHPERFVDLSPEHPGAFAWLDAKTLQFRPADPWPPLARFRVKAKEASVSLSTLMVPPSATIPSDGAVGLDPVEAITLTFPEPLDAGALARMASIELRPLPGIDGAGARWLTGQDFKVKAIDRRSTNDPATYVLALGHPIPSGTRVLLHLRLSLDDEARESPWRLSFATADPFRVLTVGSRSQRYPVSPAGSRYSREQALNAGSGEKTLIVEFSAVAREMGAVEGRNLVRFTPAVENLSFTVAGRLLEIGGNFHPDTVYRVTLVPTPIADVNGRTLRMVGDSELHLYFPSEPAYLRWGATQGIVERLGPQLVPIEGRGDERVDLRILPIDPLDRSFWPFPRSPIVVDESSRPPGPGEEPGSYDDTVRPISAEAIASRIAALGSPVVSKLVALPLRRKGTSATFGLDLEPYLSLAAGKGRPGTYLVGIRRLDGSSSREWMRVQATDLSLTTVEEPTAVRFVVTSLSTGKPVPGARVTIEAVGFASGRSPDLGWGSVVEGTTDSDGAFRWVLASARPTRSPAVRRIVVRSGDDLLILDPSHAPEGYKDNRWFPTRETWLQWTQGSLIGRGARPETLCHIFTERPVYRPDEAVHIKGYLRKRERGTLAIAAMQAVLVVTGPGDLEWRYPVGLTNAGSFHHAFSEPNLPTGDYAAEIEDKSRGRYGRVRFKIEAYRIPQFEVQLHAPDRTPLDREFDVKLTATYYAGGRVAGRPVQWRVTQFPYSWTPKKLDGFLYSSDARFSGGGRFESTARLERQDSTDDEGAASLVLNPAIEPTAQPRSYVVEATVTGADDQTVTSTQQIVALPPFVLGLKAPRYLEKAKAIEPEIVVLGPDDSPIPGTDVTLRLLHRQWHSHLRASDFSSGQARYITDVVDEKISERIVRSGSAPVAVSLPIAKAGVYVVEIEAHDRLGRAQVVSVDLYAGGGEPVAWSKPSTRVFSVTADKDAYDPGDSAALVIESPFQSGSVLAIVEGPDGNEYRWLEVTSGAATFQLPVRGAFAPRIPVHFVLMRGRVPGTVPVAGSVTDLGKPETLAATAWVKVNPVDNRVTVKLEHPEKARPGQKIDVTIRLSDPDGRPLPGEVTLWLVDQAVLALGKERRLDPVPDFLTEVRSYLVVRDTRNLAFGFLPYAERPGGGAGENLSDVLERATVRRRFAPVPYYSPAIEVGPDGTAKVTIELSDDLTNFKVRAKAASGAERFGWATGTIAVRLPVIVQPALPRFLRPGDRFTGGAIGRIVEGEGGPGAAEVKVEGVTLEGPSRREIDWSPDRPERIEFEVGVPTPSYTTEGQPALEEATFRVGVARSSDGAADTFEVKIPIRDDRPRAMWRLLQDLEPGKPVVLPPIEEKARPGTIRRSVLVSSQPGLVRMAAGLDYLLAYPHGCTEQRISLSRAAIATKRLRTLLHEEGSEARLDRAVQDALSWIPTVVDSQGLCAYWPGGRGYVSLTAWALDLLVEAKDAGYTVDGKLFDTLTRSLQQSLRSDYSRFIDGEAYAERSWALSALTSASKFDSAYAAELARRSQFLDLEGTAQVALAFARAGQGSAPAVPALAQSLTSGVVTRLHQGREIYGGLQERRTRSGLILPSETRTVAEVTRALARVDAENPRLQILVDAIVALGRDDGWGSTNANASALLALSEMLRPPFQGLPRRSVEIRVADTKAAIQTGPDVPVGYWTSGNAERGEVLLTSGGGSGRMVVRAETSYVPLAAGSEVAPLARGFVVSREILRVRTEGEAPERTALDGPGGMLAFRIGDVIEEHVRVVNPQDGSYVAVVVPLAAGMEPLNPRLATAPPEAKPKGALTRPPTYAAFLDDRVTFYYDELPKGTYDFYFRTRASVRGRFQQPAARAEMMYDLAVTGNSAGAIVDITRAGP